MGYFKNVDIEKAQRRFEEQEAERIAAAYRQPTLGIDFSDYPGADSLLDFVKVFNARKAAFQKESVKRAVFSEHGHLRTETEEAFDRIKVALP